MQLFRNKIIKAISIISLGLLFIVGVSSFYNNFIVHNVSISEPLGYYLKLPIGDIKKERRYMLCLDKQEYVDIMHSLGLPNVNNECPFQSPFIIKQVAGMPGDWVTANESGIFINGIYQLNTAPIFKHRNILLRPLPFTYNHKLESDEYFMLGVTRTSYDSRYFGTIRRDQFRKRLIMLMNNN